MRLALLGRVSGFEINETEVLLNKWISNVDLNDIISVPDFTRKFFSYTTLHITNIIYRISQA